MANPFDIFDAPVAAGGAMTASPNPFDQFDEAPEAATTGGIGRAVGLGGRDALKGILGLPLMAGDAAMAAVNIPIQAAQADPRTAGIRDRIGALGPQTAPVTQPLTGALPPSQGFDRLLTATGLPEAETPGERVRGRVIEGAAGALTGVGLARSIAKTAAGPVTQGVAEALTAQPVMQTVASATGGLAGGLAHESGADPWTELALSVLGGVAPAAVVGGIPAAGRTAVDYVAPFVPGMRPAAAGRIIRNRASDPEALARALDADPVEIVPGSAPTTFQQTGDMGIGMLERQIATGNPEPFNARRAVQNNARLEALEGLERTGDPKAVSSFFQGHLTELDDAVTAARADLDALGPAAAARLSGMQEANAAEVAGLRTTADRQADAIGGRGTADQYGAQARRAMQDAGDRAKAAAGRLLNAVDPDGTMVVNAAPLRQGATAIRREMSPAAAPMEGAERDIFNYAQMVKNGLPFRDLMALRERLSEAMRAESKANGQSQSFRRMTMLRGEIEGTMAATIERRAEQDVRAVAMGTMDPQQTAATYLRRSIASWHEQRAGEAGRQHLGEAVGGSGASGTGGVSSASGTAGQGGRSLRGTPGDQGVPGADSSAAPTYLDEAARARLNEGTDAYRQYAETFKRGPVGELLRRGETARSYRLPDASVSTGIFKPGPDGFRRAEAFMSAAGRETAEPVLADIAAMQLRRLAARADGTLDPAKVARFRRDHADALRAIPDTDARFATVEGAERAIADAAVRQRAAIETAQADAAAEALGAKVRLREAEQARRGHDMSPALLRANTDQDVARVIGGMFGSKTAASDFAKLAGQVKDNPDALQGTRRAIAKWIQSRFITTTEAGTSGQDEMASATFQRFIREHNMSLAPFFNAEERAAMQSIADDLHRANRSIVSTKLPGGPNTAADLLGSDKLPSGGGQSFLRYLAHAAAGTGAGTMAGGPLGSVLGALGAGLANRWRDAGIASIEQLITDAMLDPRKARDLLRRAPTRPHSIEAGSLAGALARSSVIDQDDDRRDALRSDLQRMATGGR